MLFLIGSFDAYYLGPGWFRITIAFEAMLIPGWAVWLVHHWLRREEAV